MAKPQEELDKLDKMAPTQNGQNPAAEQQSKRRFCSRPFPPLCQCCKEIKFWESTYLYHSAWYGVLLLLSDSLSLSMWFAALAQAGVVSGILDRVPLTVALTEFLLALVTLPPVFWIAATIVANWADGQDKVQ